MDVQSEIYINAEETPGKLYTKILTVIISAEWWVGLGRILIPLFLFYAFIECFIENT